MKRQRRNVRVLRPAWQPMQNATFGDEIDAKFKAADPYYVGVFQNHLYQVTMREYPQHEGGTDLVTWLIIRRRDSEAIHDWRHFQQIKNELCGPEREAIELYPAESRLVDTSNQFHLFVMPEGVTLPFGYTERDVSDASNLESWNRNKQRPFDKPPAGLNAKKSGDLNGQFIATLRTGPGPRGPEEM